MGKRNRKKNSAEENDNAKGSTKKGGDGLGDDYTVCSELEQDDLEAGFEDGFGAEETSPTDVNSDSSPELSDRFLSALQSCPDIPFLKRSTARESAYKLLFKALSQFAVGPSALSHLHSHLSDFIQSCLTGLRNSAQEQYACCRCIEACAVVLGANNDEYVTLVSAPLTAASRATGKSPAVRSAALRALSMSVFICGTDQEETELVMDLAKECTQKKWRGSPVIGLLWEG